MTVRAAGTEVRISHPDKVFFGERGETKLDLVRYYEAIADPFLSALGDRPTLMQRFPDGAGGKSFFQKRVPAGAPEWLRTTTVSTPNDTRSNALVLADLAHVLWAVNLGCLGFHPWPYRVADPEATDEIRIDLDPSPGVVFAQVREAALLIREFLDEEGITSFVKTSGSRGLHVHVPVAGRHDSYDVRRAAVSIARAMERRQPDLVTGRWWKEERGARVFIDFNQNAPHKTVFGAWCVRPRVGAQVSCPIRWDEVEAVDPESLTIVTVPDKVERDGDPWASMYDEPQDITDLVARWWRDLDAGILDEPWPPQYPKQPHEPPRVSPSRAAAPED